MKLHGLVLNSYIYVSVRDWHIPRIGLALLLILGIYKSLTDTWMWKLGTRPRNFIYENICLEFSVQCLWSAKLLTSYFLPLSDTMHWRYDKTGKLMPWSDPMQNADTPHQAHWCNNPTQHIPDLTRLLWPWNGARFARFDFRAKNNRYIK